MKFGPLEFGRKNSECVKCFRVADLGERDAKDPWLCVNIERALVERGITNLGCNVDKNLWCIEDCEGGAPVAAIFESFDLKIKEADPSLGSTFGRWSISLTRQSEKE